MSKINSMEDIVALCEFAASDEGIDDMSTYPKKWVPVFNDSFKFLYRQVKDIIEDFVQDLNDEYSFGHITRGFDWDSGPWSEGEYAEDYIGEVQDEIERQFSVLLQKYFNKDDSNDFADMFIEWADDDLVEEAAWKWSGLKKYDGEFEYVPEYEREFD